MGMTDLTGLSRDEVERTLKQIVFCSARDWVRSIRIDHDVRGLFVRALAAYRSPTRLQAENDRLRAALRAIRDTKDGEGFHTRQAQALQRLAETALGQCEDNVETMSPSDVDEQNASDVKAE